MGIILLVLLLALILGGLGFAIHILWWIALVVLVIWEISARLAHSLFVPPISRIVATFATEWLAPDPRTLFTSELFRENVLPSLERFAGG